MGSTRAGRALLLFCCILALAGSARAQVIDAVPLPTGTIGGDPVDELMTWLDELCAFVHCPLDTSISAQDSLHAEKSAILFVLSYESFGVRQDLSPEDRKYGELVAARALQLLKASEGEFDAEVEAALFDTLDQLGSELVK